MFDYRGLEALYIVLEVQSFEAAAKKLRITQSAVSQRIKSLETSYGGPLIIRTLPYRPTQLGGQLIGHFKRVMLLEEDLEKSMRKEGNFSHISIALNRDSLETWFLGVMEQRNFLRNILLEIIADDQELTINYLKNGLVSACLSTQEKEILGGKCHFLGEMEYILTASPEFFKKYFSKRNFKNCLLEAPALKFDQNDSLHERYLERFFGISEELRNFHIIPSVRGFKNYALLGLGYGLIPKIDILQELQRKVLVNVFPERVWRIPLYWHSWAIESEIYQKFNKEIIHLANQILKI